MLPAWAWVLLFGGIALIGAALIALLLRNLWRKVTALLQELDVLAGRLGELADLAGQIEIPDRLGGSDPYAWEAGTDGALDSDLDSDLTVATHDRPVRRT